MRRKTRSGFSDQFDLFTPRAKEVLQFAQDEAQRFNHNYIGTEHLLLGLVREDDGVAAKVLANLGIKLNTVRSAVEFIITPGTHVMQGEIGLTPRAKKVIELAQDEARHMNRLYLSTEHLLLALLREGENIAAAILETLGLKLSAVRVETERVLNLRATAPEDGEPPLPQRSAGPKNNVITCRLDDRSIDALNALVDTGIRTTRSDAAAWLIAAGIDAHRALFDRLASGIQTSRQLR